MSFQLSWQIEGEQQLSRRLRGLQTDLKDFSKPLKIIAGNLIKVFSSEVFDTQGAAIGERWARLSPATVAAKARKGFSSAPLIATGTMKDNFYSVVSSDQALVSNREDYFRYHQSNKPRSKIPRRVMMKIDEERKQMIVKEFQKFIMQAQKS